MKMCELQKDSTIVEWFDTINPTENTIRSYLNAMQTYTDFVCKTPEELINEAESEISDGILPRKRMIKKYLVNFRKHLIGNNLADKTVQGYMGGVRSFYAAFDIEIPKMAKSERAVTILEENLPIPTKEDLQEVLKVCDPLEKAILLIGVSSGLSCIDIISLRVKQFKEGYDNVTGITTLKLRRTKTKYDFITFLSPEASQAVNDYLNYRNRKAKSAWENRYNQLEKQRVFSDNDYLFCKQNIPDTFLKTRDENERKLNNNILIKVYRTISEKACQNTPHGNWNLIRSHNMRRYFDSALKNVGCDSFHVEFWLGHKLSATQEAYFRASPEKLRDIYLKFVPYLTIQKDLNISESPEYQRIKNENAVLQAETARHIVERHEIRELKEAVQQLQNKGIEQATIENQILEIIKIKKSGQSDETTKKKLEEHKLRMKQDKQYRDQYEQYEEVFLNPDIENAGKLMEILDKQLEESGNYIDKRSTLIKKMLDYDYK